MEKKTITKRPNGGREKTDPDPEEGKMERTRSLRGTPVAEGVNFGNQRSPGRCILHVFRWSGLVASDFDQLATR